jgi:hypothetical protein
MMGHWKEVEKRLLYWALGWNVFTQLGIESSLPELSNKGHWYQSFARTPNLVLNIFHVVTESSVDYQ